MKLKNLILFILSSITHSQKIFGDGILTPTTPIQKYLESLSNQTFENYAVTGAKLQPGWVISIPVQYDIHKKPVSSFVLFNGGGNDMFPLQQNCIKKDKICLASIDDLSLILKRLVKEMKTDGVKTIFYLGPIKYPQLYDSINYAYYKMNQVCQKNDGCILIDLRDLKINLQWDHIHPTNEGYKMIAEYIWYNMKQVI